MKKDGEVCGQTVVDKTAVEEVGVKTEIFCVGVEVDFPPEDGGQGLGVGGIEDFKAEDVVNSVDVEKDLDVPVETEDQGQGQIVEIGEVYSRLNFKFEDHFRYISEVFALYGFPFDAIPLDYHQWVELIEDIKEFEFQTGGDVDFQPFFPIYPFLDLNHEIEKFQDEIDYKTLQECIHKT